MEIQCPFDESIIEKIWKFFDSPFQVQTMRTNLPSNRVPVELSSGIVAKVIKFHPCQKVNSYPNGSLLAENYSRFVSPSPSGHGVRYNVNFRSGAASKGPEGHHYPYHSCIQQSWNFLNSNFPIWQLRPRTRREFPFMVEIAKNYLQHRQTPWLYFGEIKVATRSIY